MHLGTVTHHEEVTGTLTVSLTVVVAMAQRLSWRAGVRCDDGYRGREPRGGPHIERACPSGDPHLVTWRPEDNISRGLMGYRFLTRLPPGRCKPMVAAIALFAVGLFPVSVSADPLMPRIVILREAHALR